MEEKYKRIIPPLPPLPDPAPPGKEPGWKIPRFLPAMATKFKKEWGSNKVGSTAKAYSITDKKTKYLRLGYTQNPRKVEMAKCGAATTKKRGPAYDPRLNLVDTGGLKEEGFKDKSKISADVSSNPSCKL